MVFIPPMITSGVSTLSPASTYPDLLFINNAGQGLNNTPSQIQDGLGNNTNLIISSNYFNINRSPSFEFQIGSVALTADIATLNALAPMADAQFVTLSPNPSLKNSRTLSARNGLRLTHEEGSLFIEPDPDAHLFLSPQAQVSITTGLAAYQNGALFQTVLLTGDATINVTNPDGIAGNPIIGVVADQTRQRVNVELNGVFQSQKSQLNFIPGKGTGIVVADNPGANRTDITISSTGGGGGGGFNFWGTAYAATTLSLNATYNNGAAGVGATLTNAGAFVAFQTDGVTPPVNSFILVQNQAVQAQNGIYTLTNAGNGATAWVLTRATNYNSPSTITAGSIVLVLNGTLYGSTAWVQTQTVTVVGTSPILFDQFSITGTISQILGTAGQIDVAGGTGPTATISIDPAYIGQASITTLGTITTGTWHGTTIDVAHGGTGDTTFETYGVVCGGTTATNPLQTVVGNGTAGQVLTSSGAGALPTWQNAGAAQTLTYTVVQANSFVAGNIISINPSGTFVLAKADNAADAGNVVGIVTAANGTQFTFQFAGVVTGLVGLIAGSAYWLDSVTAGNYTTVQPSAEGTVTVPLFVALSTSTALWNPPFTFAND